MRQHRIVAARSFLGALVTLALAACGGGGGGGGTGVSFSFATSGVGLTESDGPTDVEVVLHTVDPALLEDVTVNVADLGNGTATSGADYTAFPTQTLTFTAGAIDGDSQTVTLDPLADLLVEGSGETVRLRLQGAVGGKASGQTQFTATLADEQAAVVEFASVGSTTATESGAQSVALELQLDAGVTLAVAVSVRISDLHTGSATSGSDYSSFAARTVTFPVGSANGALQTVDLQITNDNTTEGDETIELGLSQPSAACTLGALEAHVLTIHDDEVGGNAAFLASEGATGTGNNLSHDELLDLGSQTVGAGPNTGTLVRVANGGGLPIALGTPSLIGSNDEDFDLEIESSSLASGTHSAGFVAEAERSPLVARGGDDGPGVALRLDPARVARLSGMRQVLLSDFELPGLDRVTLELTRRPLPLTADAKLVVDGIEIAGGPRTLLGDLQLWSGSIVELPGSRVFLGLTGSGAQGFVELPFAQDRLVEFVNDGPGQVRLVREQELAALGQAPRTAFCAGEQFVPGVSGVQHLTQDPPTESLTLADCRLAIETDYQYYQLFGSSVLLTNYVTEQIAAISEQYVTDVQTTLSIAYLGIHTDSNDGWTTPDDAGMPGVDAFDLLNEFRLAWAGGWPASADLAHFFSGADLGGGVAYVDALCRQDIGFGVSANLTGSIDWGAWTGASAGFTWDFVVVAHELGHNFGSQHTHDYCPPLDHCYTNCDSTVTCTRGTLMSYCHVSCGGLGNIDLYFHPVTANIMRQSVNSSCLDDAQLPPGEFVQYRLRFNPLLTTGARSATLEFPHDAPNVTHPFHVLLTGTAN